MPSSPPDDARRIFSGIGATYDRAGAVLSFGQDARWRERLVSLLDAGSEDVVLDVATGTGLVARAIAERYGCHVVGLDRSADMLSAAAARDGHIPLVRARAESLPFPDGSFDAIYAMLCLLHVPPSDLDQVLRRLKALLRPDGLLFVGVYGGQDEEGLSPNDDHDPPRFFSFRSDETLLAAARKHFEVVDFHVVEPDDFHFQSLTLRRSDTVNAS